MMKSIFLIVALFIGLQVFEDKDRSGFAYHRCAYCHIRRTYIEYYDIFKLSNRVYCKDIRN